MRASRTASAAATSAASKRCGMCCGQLASHADTVNRITCSGVAAITLRHQLGDQLGVAFDHARLAPELHPLARLIINEEKDRLGIVREITQRDVLLVAAEVGEADRPVVKHLEEAWRAATVLNVRLTVLVGRTEKSADLVADKRGEVRRDPVFPPTTHLQIGVAAARALAGLHRLHQFENATSQEAVRGLPMANTPRKRYRRREARF